MKTLVRWGRFNLVGAMGVVVQLAVLAALGRVVGRHYLVATAAAIEVAVVHNFVWHVRYTWQDRGGESGVVGQFVRFQVANGLVSLVGNLVVMRVLVQAGVPLLVANGVAIVCCSAVNFYLGNVWAFRGGDERRSVGLDEACPRG